MGWVMFGMGRAGADFSDIVLFLLLGGGVAYSCGALLHAQDRLPFHNVAWHGLVLLGASLHWAAAAGYELARSIGGRGMYGARTRHCEQRVAIINDSTWAGARWAMLYRAA